ncbi:periplasmic chaperone for outer membrane proteins Skp [Pseudarcicella hirudinis]|uniref:Periplasmic chaperone for outer membrane proteins Skp n=1 Tax=Pseudarcicella hirudinis TaxID=1079859 RepID=A0A1I5Z1L3_9BACT|nr:OmpH family outer membrane protein [Pseudarcicella hirudinis]SFQ50322.1 periplasmic chaperone for outer membrane proteins Skp [Pseudarcicella hirudinis]
MKKQIFLLILAFLCFSRSAKAQKFGYVDLEYITSKMPEYQTAQAEIEKLTSRWIKEISDKNLEIEKLEKAYRAEEVLLTEDMKQQRLKAISEKEKEAKDMQNKVFGINGELIKKKQDIIKPILDEISKALEKVVRQKRLDFVFDKSSDGLTMVYTNPVHDYTDYVMEELGISPEQIKDKEKEKAESESPNNTDQKSKNKKSN